MGQLKVIAVGTSPAETFRLEEALLQIGYLEKFRYIGLEQSMERVPDWGNWDLVLARYHEQNSDAILSLLAPPLRESAPPVFFLVDAYDPLVLTRLMNAGARRVLPVDMAGAVLQQNLDGIFAAVTATQHASQAETVDEYPAEIISIRNDQGLLMPKGGLARIFQNSPIGISINRLTDGRCVDCNESLARMLEWPREDLVGQDALELGLWTDLKRQFDPDQHAGVDRSPVQFERKIFTRTRQIRLVQIHLDLIEWNGEPCAIAMVQDITEKEQAKEKIKRLNDELERLVLIRTGALEAANRELAAEIGRRKVLEDFSNQLSQVLWETPDIVAIYAPDEKMQFLNKAGRNFFNLSQDEPVSHLDLFSAYTAGSRAWVREKVQPFVIRDGIWRGEAEFQLSGGRVFPVSQVLVCKKDDLGNIQYFATIARDVSDFKFVEQELRQSRERYRNLAEAAHDFIFMVSKEGLMEYANEFTCQALGVRPDEVQGIPASQFFPKDFAASNLQFVDEVNEIDRPIYAEGPFLANGQEIWLGTWLVPIHNDNGSMGSILGIARDITEQKRTDVALQRALQNERKLNEMRSNFFSMTSHQFRTPLSTILLSAELLLKYGPRWDDQKRAEHLGRISEASRRLNDMLEDILVIGRTESGHYVCSPKEFDLVAFCSQTILEFSTNDQNRHKLLFEHEPDTLPVFLDPEVMHRVVDNLLSNAIKYSPKGSPVTLGLKTEDQHVLVEVTDHGIGIPEQDLKFLFQPFQRGSNAAEYPGTGIGLTIIQKSVELMNGSVSLKSREGEGTTFVVRFPTRFEPANRTLA